VKRPHRILVIRAAAAAGQRPGQADHGDNLWAAVKGLLDGVPVDVFTVPTALPILVIRQARFACRWQFVCWPGTEAKDAWTG
jgi:hypothetical protein